MPEHTTEEYPYPPEPPPLDVDALEPPPPEFDAEPYDYDHGLAYDPYPPINHEPLPIPDDFVPEGLRHIPDLPPPGQDGLQGFESPEPDGPDWSWHDARLIGVDRGEDAGENRYEVGAIDVYRDSSSGDLGGSYLPITSFAEESPANGYFHDLNQQIHDDGLPPHKVPDFAEEQALTANKSPEYWRGADMPEYEAYDYIRELDDYDPSLADTPPDEAIDPLIQHAIELGGVVAQEIETPQTNEATFRALDAIGVQAENFDPDTDPPPFYDAETRTAYWVGVFQADKDDPENCVTSILSLGRDPETGEMEAQLAPCVPGDWDKAYGAAEHLIQIAQKGDIEQVFDTAEGMALATDQRELWEAKRGLPLEQDDADDIADYTSDNWGVDL